MTRRMGGRSSKRTGCREGSEAHQVTLSLARGGRSSSRAGAPARLCLAPASRDAPAIGIIRIRPGSDIIMSESAAWSTAAFDGGIVVGEIHVWLAMLDRLDQDQSSSVLSPDEQERAARFVFARDRQRFVAAHLLLRRLLARHLRTTPAEVCFSSDRNGKPTLSGYAHPPSFNLSHSQDAVVIAISLGGEVGIDIEAIRPVAEAERIAARFFAPGEIEAFRSVALAERERAFFSCWTRKEAFVKAVGSGLRHALRSFEVTLRPGEPARIVHAGTMASEARGWTLTELPAVPGYVGALAARGNPRAIHYHAWSDSECREGVAGDGRLDTP